MRMIRSLLLAGVAALLVATGTATAGAATAPAARPVVPVAVYVSDVAQAAAGLNRYGTVLEKVASLDDVAAAAPRARAGLLVFDRHTYVLSRYRLRDPGLNRQRARLARTAPGVTGVLSAFLDAAVRGDVDRVQKLLPAVLSRITAFQRAATG